MGNIYKLLDASHHGVSERYYFNLENCLLAAEKALKDISHECKIERLKMQDEFKAPPRLEKHQLCGCIVCTCEDEEQCQGCGVKHCGTHPVGEIPVPIYEVEQ